MFDIWLCDLLESRVWLIIGSLDNLQKWDIIIYQMILVYCFYGFIIQKIGKWIGKKYLYKDKLKFFMF